MGRNVVPSLQSLAFMVSYKDLFTYLGLCRDYMKEKETDGGEALPDLPFYASLDGTISYVRARLSQSQHLVGTMSDEIRKMYVKKFYGTLREVMHLFADVAGNLSGNSMKIASKKKEYWEIFNENSFIQAWTLLDCVLDENFKELKIDAVLPFQDPDPKLITTIATRSSELEKLELNFSFIDKFNNKTRENFYNFVLELSSLQHLTNLSLHGLPVGVDHTLFKSVAKSCPRLSYLSIRNCYVLKVDVLSLIIIGELVDGMFKGCREVTKWSVDKTLQSLRVPPEYLTPMCFTLQHLELGNSNLLECLDSTLAFTLRHLAVLQKLVRDPSEIGTAVKIFHETFRMEEFQTEFEEFCRGVVKSSEKPNPHILPTERAMLSLTTLSGVDVSNKALLDIIGKSCPFLKDVTFHEKELSMQMVYNKIRSEPKLEEKEFLNSFIEDIESILSDWPKLESVNFNRIPQSIRDVLLKVFGKGLRQLTFDCCTDINLDDLLPYHQLENLRFLSPFNSSISPTNSKIKLLVSKEYLPQLKSLESQICLGSTWSRVFEEKSTLTSVNVSCLHIGTKASSHANWNSLPMMWPNLEILHIPQCDGLTMEMVLDLLPRLNRLKIIHLPYEIGSPAGFLTCYYPPSPIKFKDCLHDARKCVFLAPKDTHCGCDSRSYLDDNSPDLYYCNDEIYYDRVTSYSCW